MPTSIELNRINVFHPIYYLIRKMCVPSVNSEYWKSGLTPLFDEHKHKNIQQLGQRPDNWLACQENIINVLQGIAQAPLHKVLWWHHSCTFYVTDLSDDYSRTPQERQRYRKISVITSAVVIALGIVLLIIVIYRVSGDPDLYKGARHHPAFG